MERRAGFVPAPEPDRRAIRRALLGFVYYVAAAVWRTLLFRTTFITVTGSFGKTTAKDCLGAILSLSGPTVITDASNNEGRGICETILRARPRHRFVVLEVALPANGGIVSHAFLTRPNVAVILGAGHAWGSFKQWGSTRRLRRNVITILNIDDPLLKEMASRTHRRVIRFGFGEDCVVRGSQASSTWPCRLQLLVSTPDETRVIYTRLVGTHWAPSVLGAIAAAYACGVTLRDAWKVLQEVHPHAARLQPVPLPSGAVMFRDEANGAPHSFEAALAVVRDATARRKVLVISDCSHSPQNEQQRQRYLALRGARIFDSVVFVGEWSHYGLKHALSAGMDPDHVHGFVSITAVSEFLRHYLREDDLVLLRGRAMDHLSRIYHSQFGTVKCSKKHCERPDICDSCPELGAVRTSEASVQDVELLQLPCWKEEGVRVEKPVKPTFVAVASQQSEKSAR